MVEHNLEVIKTADWVIDLSPEGGDGGRRMVAEGRPEDIAKAEGSYTGKFLTEILKRRPAKRAPAAAAKAAE
jgi:excinuclease ABC subunit A